MTQMPPDVHRLLRRASQVSPHRPFTCLCFPPHWNAFVETWAPKIHAFVAEALGPYGTQPKREILLLRDSHHMACANASFDLVSGQIRLGTHLVDQPGVTIEKLLHEHLHASTSQWPMGDPFYDEGVAADYPTWVLAHAPIWEPYRDQVIQAAADNIRNRRERALRTGSDYDRKRWAGGVYAMTAYGPYIIAMLRQKKAEGNFTW